MKAFKSEREGILTSLLAILSLVRDSTNKSGLRSNPRTREVAFQFMKTCLSVVLK